jgi:flagellar hook-associated protein 2
MADNTIASISGLASGIQWRDMIDQIMKIEHRPVDRINARITAAETRNNIIAQLKTRMLAFSDATRGVATGETLRAMSVSASAPSSISLPLTASGSAAARPGTHQILVQRLAKAERLGSDLFAKRDVALNHSGDFRINGRTITIATTDSLDAIAARINALNTGPQAIGVSASVALSTGGKYKLTLTSVKTGAAGIDLVDGSTGSLRVLGFLESGTSLKHGTSNGARSDVFTDSTTPLAQLLGLNVAAETVTVGGAAIGLDLSTMSVDDVAAAINSANVAGLSASVVTEESGKRIQISGTTQMSGRSLEILGLVQGNRGAVAQTVASAQLTTVALAPATATTTFADLGVTGSTTLSINGSRGDGTAVNAFEFAANEADTVQSLMTALQTAFDADVAIVGGRITITDRNAGDSRLALSVTSLNQGSSRVDLGMFTTTVAGRAREVVDGQDAAFVVDGAHLTSATNTVADIVPGVTLNLLNAGGGIPATVEVIQDSNGAVTAIKKIVDSFNSAMDFLDAQMKPKGPGAAPPPLHNDPVARSLRNALREAMAAVVTPSQSGGFTRLGDIGIEIDRNGRYTVSDTKLKDAVTRDLDGVMHLFGTNGKLASSAFEFVGSTDASVPGNYNVAVTRAAERASTAGAYTPADGSLTINDSVTGGAYTIAIDSGLTITQFVDRLNAELSVNKVAGRARSTITASEDNGSIRLTHGEHGSTAALTVSYGGAYSVGINAGTYAGVDIAGTIDGHAATGVGQLLTAAADTRGVGLAVRYTGNILANDTLKFTRGVAGQLLKYMNTMSGSANGSFEAVTRSVSDSITQMRQRADTIETRLERRRAELVRRFTAMEQAMSRAQNQSQWLNGQISALEAMRKG